jgi:hypothetical protein
MMKITTNLLLVATFFLSSVDGLAFVTFIMRPAINPFKTMHTASTPSVAHLSNAANTNSISLRQEAAACKLQPKNDDTFGSDASTRAYRSEMLDLVYQRQLDWLDSFSQ